MSKKDTALDIKLAFLAIAVIIIGAFTWEYFTWSECRETFSFSTCLWMLAR
ncbi:hypothetical protein Peetri_00179 [Pseudomonas phage vB_PpuM-Peetri]